MDPEAKIPEIPNYTPERPEDPPGISIYTPQIPPTQRMRREDNGENTATDDEHLAGQNRNIFDSKIIWLLAEPIGQ